MKKRISHIFLHICFAMLIVSTAYADFGLMLGSFRDRGNAEKYRADFLKNHADKNLDAFIEKSQLQGRGTWYRVITGPFVDRTEVSKQKGRLDAAGLDSVIVVVKSNPAPLAAPKAAQENIGQQTRKAAPQLIPPDASTPENIAKAGNEDEKLASESKPRTLDEIRAPKVEAKNLAFEKEISEREEQKKGEKQPFQNKNQNGILTNTPDIAQKEISLSAGDILEIQIPGQKEMSQSYDVDPDGNIFMLTIGKIEVTGLTPGLLEQKLTKLARQLIVKGEHPVVRIKDQLRFIDIQGGVNYPGWYRVPRLSKLDELITIAGGLVDGVDTSGILLKRLTETGYREIRITKEIILHPNDILFIPSPKELGKKIDSGDLLFINMPKASTTTDLSDMERKVVQNQIEVDRNGYVYIPDYGHIYVNNKFPREIEQIVIDRLPKYLAGSAKIHISIIEKRHYIQILGHVRTPGWYNIPESANIQSALSMAGSAVDGAIMSKIAITRKWGGSDHRLLVNLYQFTITGDIRLLTPIHEKDTLFVPISSFFGSIKRTLGDWSPPTEKLEEDTGSKIRIFGAVGHPGVYESKEDMNLLDLLITAGGNSVNADLGKVLLIRENRSKAYDLNDLILKSIQGTIEMPKVQNGDSVYVTFMKQAGQEATEPKKMIRIFGGVKDPGIYDPIEDMNLMDIFALAKGGTYDADLAKVMISRRDGTFLKFDMQEFLDSKNPDPTKLPKIFASDTIFVAYLQHLDLEKKEPVYVLGKVQSPGQYDLAEGGMTVFQMIAYAGGLEEWADTDNIMIIRNISGRQQNIPFNFKKALSGKSPELNIRLHAFDTLYVP